MIGAVTIELSGPPVAWARTRLGTRGVPFTPKKQRNNAATLRLAAQEAMDGRMPLDCPLHIELLARLPIAQSWPKKKQAAARKGELLPTGRPDLSNFLKQVEDAFNGVVFRDDSLIVDATLSKQYSAMPGLTITVSPLGVSGLREARPTLDDVVLP